MKNLKESAAERQQRTGARKTQRPAKDKSISPTTHCTMLVSDKASGPADKKSVSKEGLCYWECVIALYTNHSL